LDKWPVGTGVSKQVYYSVPCRLFKIEQLASKHIAGFARTREAAANKKRRDQTSFMWRKFRFYADRKNRVARFRSEPVAFGFEAAACGSMRRRANGYKSSAKSSAEFRRRPGSFSRQDTINSFSPVGSELLICDTGSGVDDITF
jgi:hypothetical protein